MITATRHTGITVTDPVASMFFYQTLLGLEKVEERHEQGDYIERHTGMIGIKIDWVKLASPDGVLVELQHINSHRRPSPPRDYASVGINHLCFTVSNVKEMYHRLIAADVRCHSVQTDPPGKVRNMVCFDPDGTIIELVEEL